MTGEVSRTIRIIAIYFLSGPVDQLHFLEGGWTYDLYQLKIQLLRVETI